MRQRVSFIRDVKNPFHDVSRYFLQDIDGVVQIHIRENILQFLFL